MSLPTFEKSNSMSSQRASFLLKPLLLIWSYRNNLFEGVKQDLRQQYSGSALGMVWIMLYPMLQLGIYCALYVFIFKVRPAGLTQSSYIILVFAGLVPILAFNQAVQVALGALRGNPALLASTVFPPTLFVVRAVLVAQLPMAFGMVVTLVAAFSMGLPSVGLVILYLPILWILLLGFAVGVGWVLSLVTLVARDLQHSIGLFLMLMTFLSPFAYTPDMVPAGLKPILYMNPMTYFVRSFQDFICYGVHPEWFSLLGAFLLGIGGFYMGYLIFERSKVKFFDYV